MPKKTRRMRQRAAMRRTAPAPAVQETVEEGPIPVQEPVVRMRPTVPTTRGVNPLTFDYSHIYGDLRRIALFAGFFFVVLIVLSFVIK
ncbi:MAG: hypothetical protein M1570_05295 [Chloroflexi bacterium]|nr:hypothetical protein [Chloroflexota bacterium]